MKTPALSTVTPRAPVKVPAEVIADLLGAIRGQFLADCGEKRWFAFERPLLLRAITYPAAFLVRRAGEGTVLPWARYQSILFTVMATIKRHGTARIIGSFGRYFFKAVQTHMAHHWEDYYAESKSAANALDAVFAKLPAATAAGRDTTVADLAKIHAALASKAGRKKTPPPAEQGTLF